MLGVQVERTFYFMEFTLKRFAQSICHFRYAGNEVYRIYLKATLVYLCRIIVMKACVIFRRSDIITRRHSIYSLPVLLDILSTSPDLSNFSTPIAFWRFDFVYVVLCDTFKILLCRILSII